MKLSRKPLTAPLDDPEEPFKPRKRPCKNCGGDMWIKQRRLLRVKKFCKEKCKNEYRNYGGMIGTLIKKLTKVVDDRMRPAELKRFFTAYASSRDFRLDLVKAGFIHRSQIEAYQRRKKPELTPKGLKGGIDILGLLVRGLDRRIKQLEHAVSPNVPA